MPGKTIGVQFNFGYPGTISRQGDEVTRTRPLSENSADTYFGDPVILNTDGTFQKFGASDTAAKFAGVAMRRVKSSNTYITQTNAYYAPLDPTDVIERGPVAVKCNVGTPAPGGTAYIRVVANEAIPLGVVGGFEASADSTNTVALTNAKWGTTKDANGVAELVILTRQSV